MSSADNNKPRPRRRFEFLPDFRRGKAKEQPQMGSYLLVVDDEPKIARLVQINLERHGYPVETASNGAEALTIIRKRRPDVLITDNWMPEMNGYELLVKIRRDPALMGLLVILLQDKPFDLDQLSSWDTAADMYLSKPFNPAELITFVKRALRRNDGHDGLYGEQPDGSFLIIDF